MNMSIPQTLRVFVVLGLMLAITGSVAYAQQMGLPYTEAPFTPITPQMMSIGRWYISGGARWRNGQNVLFDKTPDSGGYTVPFGPRVPGNFSFTRASNNAGVWIYDNGDINPNNPQQNPQVFQIFNWPVGNTSTVETNPGDRAWTTSSSLGAQVFQWTNPIPPPDPNNWSYYNVGSFSVQNINQFSPLLPTPATATFGNATSVSYDLTLNQLPQLPTVTDGGFTSQAFDNSIWGPYVEIGFWSGSFVSITYSFSAFSFSNSFQKNMPATLYPYATSLTDSYNFSSIGSNLNGTPAPPNPTIIAPNFTSIKSGNSPPVLYSYSLDPLSGNRVFKDALGNTLPPVAVIENLSVGLNANCYENRLAVLNMGPVLPPFELGMSLGPVATLVHFTLNYQNIILDPNNPANVLLTNTGSQVKDQWSFGAFGSLDLRVSLPNTFFGCSFDYVYMSDIRHGLDDIQSTISPGGSSIGFGGGIKF